MAPKEENNIPKGDFDININTIFNTNNTIIMSFIE